MRLGPIRRAVRGELTRRRVQTLVIAIVLLVTTAASVIALALAADSNAPFDAAFAAQHGADLTVTVSAAKVTRAQLTTAKSVPGVSAVAGPFAAVTESLLLSQPGPGQPGPGQPGPGQQGTGPGRERVVLPDMTLAGRAAPGGPVDDVTLQQGHWATGPGQVVLADDQVDSDLPVTVALGADITVPGAPGRPVLTVVGIATSVTGSADGWVAPAEIARLTSRHAAASYQLLYRFASAATAADIRADAAAVARALPAGAVTATQSYLSARLAETSGIAPLAPFVLAFGVLGVVMSVLIVANVVSGAVVAGYRRIGVLKSIGFTPGQIVTAYAAQAVAPAAAGCLAGLALGNLLAGALLGRAANVYQVGTLGVPPWVNLAVPLGMLAVVAVAALAPASRAGRLSAAEAIAAGRAPRPGRGYLAHRALSRLALPRPLTIGLATPVSRPARASVTMIAVMLGGIAVTFAVGVGASLVRVQAGLSLSRTEQVFVVPPAPGPGGPAGQASQHSGGVPQARVTASVVARPGTAHVVAETDQQIGVAGLAQQIPVTAFRGNARWIGYELISGRWYTGPGQVDVPTYFLTTTGTAVGDTVTVTFGDRTFPVRIVGEVFSSVNNGLCMFTGWQTLAHADPGQAQVSQWDIELRPGTSLTGYVQSLGSELGPSYSVSMNGAGRGLPLVIGLISLLTLLLAAVAGLGVLNTVVLQTRERVHDLGVLKAIGMTPGQTIVMVVCWVAGIGLAAGLLAVPAGIALQHYLVPVMASAAGTALPASIIDVYGAWQVGFLALAGIAIAVAGALAPAGWAAAARTDVALRTE